MSTNTPLAAIAASTESTIASLQEIYHGLSSQASLAPSPTVNRLFSSLVELCIRTHSSSTTEAILHDPRISRIAPSLRRLCATGEFFLESAFAANAALQLSQFPYYQNYVDLVKLETSIMAAVLPSAILPQKILFLGSGPLPLSSILMLKIWENATVVNVDIDPTALQLARRVGARAGCDPERMQYLLRDAGALTDRDYEGVDLVVVGGLVGNDQKEKRRILRSVAERMRENTWLLMRSARGLRKLLYQEVDLAGLDEMGLGLAAVVHPTNDVVNSVVVAVKGAGVVGNGKTVVPRL